MIFDLFAPPQGPRGRGQKKCAVAHPIHVSNSHTKFGWISSNGLGGDSVTDGRTDGQTDGRTDGGDCNIPYAFLKKPGDNKSITKIKHKYNCQTMFWKSDTKKCHFSTQSGHVYTSNLNPFLHNAFWHLWNIMYSKILWKMEHLLFWSKCSIFHNIFKSFQNLT